MTRSTSFRRAIGRLGLRLPVRMITICLSLAALLLAVPAPAAAWVGDSANGSGSTSFDDGTGRTWTWEFSFSAVGTGYEAEATFEATGQMSLVGPVRSQGEFSDPDLVLQAEVDCLHVDRFDDEPGRPLYAEVSGMAVGLAEPHRLTFTVLDYGTPGLGKDIFFVHLSPGSDHFYCDGGFFSPAAHLNAGEITVVGAPDADNDRSPDYADNCPLDSNFHQDDADNDGLGDVCDPVTDSDNDAVADSADNCPTVANADQRDIDDDGIGDACDPSDDRTADEQLADLITELQTAPIGPGNSYMAKLEAIAGSIGDGNTDATCRKLRAFENEVQAQTGKKLTSGEADALLREAATIKTKAGCP